MPKTAIILGATGLTGGLLLETLLKDERYGHVMLFSRNTCGKKDPKLTEYLIDLFQLEHYRDKFQANEVFCCIGTTKAQTASKETYTKIDYGIPVAAASLCKENDIGTFVVMSALGANKKSKIFYNRTKGKMEGKVLEHNIEHTYILQPSLISGEREERRPGEQFMKSLMALVEPLLRFGDLARYRPVHPQTIVNCMVWLANNNYMSGRIKSKTIQEIGEKP